MNWEWITSVLLTSLCLTILGTYAYRVFDRAVGNGFGFFRKHRKISFTNHLLLMRRLHLDRDARNAYFRYQWADLAFNAFGSILGVISFFATYQHVLNLFAKNYASWILMFFAFVVFVSAANSMRQIWNIRVCSLWLSDMARSEAWYARTFTGFPEGYEPVSALPEAGPSPASAPTSVPIGSGSRSRRRAVSR